MESRLRPSTYTSSVLILISFMLVWSATVLEGILASPVPSGSGGQISTSKSIYKAESITYEPFNNDGSCKSASQVSSDMAFIRSKGISNVRIYSATDCNILSTVHPAAISNGLRIIQGFYFNTAAVSSIDTQVSSFITWGKSNGNWAHVEMVFVGNEVVLSNLMPASLLVPKIASVGAQLRSAGYGGPVGTVDVVGTYQSNPALCTSSAVGVVGVNAHPYFNSYGSAPQSGSFVQSQIQAAKQACPGKSIYVTETGYPHAGNVNGNQIPSAQNQAIAFKSILDATSGHVTAFDLYDDYWKAPGPYGVEQSFGLSSIL